MSAKPKFAERADRLLEHSAGVDTLPEVDEHQKQAVFRAMAVGFSVYTWVLPTVAIIFFASGLWWAGLLLIISAGMPALAVRMYARQLGVGSVRQTGLERRWARPTGLVLSLLGFALLGGLAIFQSTTGHPLFEWTWRIDMSTIRFESLIGGGIGVFIAWLIVRNKHRRRHH
ncbi:hypothetical protein [Brevibacterium aurantiacum]|uniref:Uncharacterized protein n=1 Tax=Brevibacterium aurantiacum TaxID=273384 RepID=A0A3T0DH89_BREAU|nr:hypothetical protein [Brevibacterium aurantiacum]AZT94139.1 hypothetical protein CXR23_14075 [Brevibacterium aurantiacum]MDN5585687.1 hypothetical protein [Brevibacterium sp.]MDN5605840.1 hypothetical protein [Kocuria sp.]